MENSSKILDCKLFRETEEEKIKNYVNSLPNIPKIAIIQLGNNESSNSYIKNKLSACKRCGIDSKLIKLSEDTKQSEILDIINRLNNDSSITGILVQHPLPNHIDVDIINDSILPCKDVDGFNLINKGKLYSNIDTLIPCTAKGIIDLLKFYEIELNGKHVVLVNRSYLVGKPLIHLFLNENSTVTVCHSNTYKLEDITSKADILVVGVGIPKFIKSNFIKEGCILLDVGINSVDNKLVGDVDFDDWIDKVSKITKVPGGIGIITVTTLLKNIIQAFNIQYNLKDTL